MVRPAPPAQRGNQVLPNNKHFVTHVNVKDYQYTKCKLCMSENNKVIALYQCCHENMKELMIHVLGLKKADDKVMHTL